MTTSIQTVVDPCGPYVFELFDRTSGADLAIEADPFPVSDLVSTTKKLDVQTDDNNKIGNYFMRLYVHYTILSSDAFYMDFRISIVGRTSCIPDDVDNNSDFDPIDLTFTIQNSVTIYESALATSWKGTKTETYTYRGYFISWKSECNLEYRYEVTPAPADPALITIIDDQFSVTTPQI